MSETQEEKRTWLGEKCYSIICKVGEKLAKHTWLIILLNYTWGLLTTIVGWIVYLVVLCFKSSSKTSYYYQQSLLIGSGWGAFSIGMISVLSNNSSSTTYQHELGHSIQNAILGILWPFLVGIPSAIRYWYRKVKNITTNYYLVWFESSASTLGEYYDSLQKSEKVVDNEEEQD